MINKGKLFFPFGGSDLSLLYHVVLIIVGERSHFSFVRREINYFVINFSTH